MGKVKLGKLKLGAVPTEKAVTDVSFDQTADAIDVTDSMSTGDSREWATGLVTRSLSFGAWFRDDDPDILDIDDTTDFEYILGAKKYSGELKIESAKVDSNMDTYVKMAYTAKVNGPVTFGTAS